VREETDRAFHAGLARATRNGSLERVVDELWNQRAEMWRRTQQHFHTRDLALKTLRDHSAILKAVAARDPDGARGAMHRHLARVEREFQRDAEGAARPPGPGARRVRAAA
jgi:DNA-binding FadR family transcriptional regulator